MKEKRHPRQKKLAKALVKHDFNKKKAFAEAYPNSSKTTVDGNAHNIFKKYPMIEEEARTLLENSLNNEGMSLPALAKGLKNVIDDPSTQRVTPQGELISLNDNNLKLKAISKAFDLHTGQNKQSPTGSTTNIQINISSDTTDKLDATLKALDAMSKKLGISEDAQSGEIVEAESSPID